MNQWWLILNDNKGWWMRVMNLEWWFFFGGNIWQQHLVMPSVHVFVALLTSPSEFSISRATHPPNTTEVLVRLPFPKHPTPKIQCCNPMVLNQLTAWIGQTPPFLFSIAYMVLQHKYKLIWIHPSHGEIINRHGADILLGWSDDLGCSNCVLDSWGQGHIHTGSTLQQTPWHQHNLNLLTATNYLTPT